MSSQIVNETDALVAGHFLSRIALPALLTVVGLTLVFLAFSSTPLAVDEIAAEAAGPTPYSAAHERVQKSPGAPEEQAPTF